MESNVQFLAFNEIGVTFAVIAIACGFVKLVWDAVKAIHDWRTTLKQPTNDRIGEVEKEVAEVRENHERRISHLEGCCDEVRGKLQNDWQFQQDEVEMNRLLLKSIKQLLKHSLDGNDTDGLARMEEEIDSYLLEHTK